MMPMTREHVWLVALAAFVTVAVLFALLVRRSGFERGVRDMKLIGNFGLIFFLYVPIFVAAGLATFAFLTGKWNYALVGLVVFGLGMALFRDLNFRHRRPLSDFFSITPEQDAVDRLWSETRELLRERRGEGEGTSGPEIVADPEWKTGMPEGGLPPELLEQLPPELRDQIRPEDVKTKTFNISFRFGQHGKSPRKR